MPPITSKGRAALSHGRSGDAVYDLVDNVVGSQSLECVVDVGCGGAAISRRLRERFRRYIGCDVIAYDGFPKEAWAEFRQVDLNVVPYPVPANLGDVVLCIECIEHVENPRALVRELLRIAKPGARVIVTTPNQLSLLSKISLLTKNEFVAFQEAPGLYPSHITALVEADLRRIAIECGLVNVEIHFTDSGRIPFTRRHWPSFMRGRAFSDNVLLAGRKARA